MRTHGLVVRVLQSRLRNREECEQCVVVPLSKSGNIIRCREVANVQKMHLIIIKKLFVQVQEKMAEPSFSDYERYYEY